MKKSARNMSVESPANTAHAGGNGTALAVAPESMPVDLAAILAGLQTMRNGDFSVRLPGSWTGLGGKIADTFNEIVCRESADGAGTAPRRPNCRQGR